MSARLSALVALRDAVEAGDLPGYAIEELACKTWGWTITGHTRDAYEGGIRAPGAALALLAAVLPGWEASVTTGGHAQIWQPVPDGKVINRCAPTPARALLLAILAALIEQEKAR